MMITGTSAHGRCDCASAGVDDFLAKPSPEDKMAQSSREQAKASLVAMTAMAPTTPLPWASRCRRRHEYWDASAKEAGNMSTSIRIRPSSSRSSKSANNY